MFVLHIYVSFCLSNVRIISGTILILKEVRNGAIVFLVKKHMVWWPNQTSISNIEEDKFRDVMAAILNLEKDNIGYDDLSLNNKKIQNVKLFQV